MMERLASVSALQLLVVELALFLAIQPTTTIAYLPMASALARSSLSCTPPWSSTTKPIFRKPYATALYQDLDHSEERDSVDDVVRRSLLHASLVSTATISATAAAWSLSSTAHAVAYDADSSSSSGLVSATSVADRLRPVPTFTLVDAKGVPYMVVGEDAKVTGYFFTSYDEAKRILGLAKTSADKGIQDAVQELRAKRTQEGLPKLTKHQALELLGISSNPWNNARVSSVPLDFAVTLVAKSMYGNTRRSGGNYFQIAPSESDVEDALMLDTTGKSELAEGKVPLFYFADFTIGGEHTSDDNDKLSPLYFHKSQLIQEWKKRHPTEKELPEVLVTELFAVLTEMVKPGGTDEDLKTLVFIPPPESEQKRNECRKKGGTESPFLLGQRNVVL